jgi:hypothetical protein
MGDAPAQAILAIEFLVYAFVENDVDDVGGMVG